MSRDRENFGSAGLDVFSPKTRRRDCSKRAIQASWIGIVVRYVCDWRCGSKKCCYRRLRLFFPVNAGRSILGIVISSGAPSLLCSPPRVSLSVLFSLVSTSFLLISQLLLEIPLFPEHQKNHSGLSKRFYYLLRLISVGQSLTSFSRFALSNYDARRA